MSAMDGSGGNGSISGQWPPQSPQQRLEASQELGFAALRRGDTQEARRIFEESLASLPTDDWANIAMIEEHLGQMEERAGQWDRAYEHYAHSLSAAIDAHDQGRMASVLAHRGLLLALRGFLVQAREECRTALEIVRNLPETPVNAHRAVNAWMAAATTYRHAKEFQSATTYFRQGLLLAEQNKDEEGMCWVLLSLGSNQHLFGRSLRRDEESLAVACQNQTLAWRYLTRGLEIAQRNHWRDALAVGLNRLAKVYRETDRLRMMAPELTALHNGVETFDELEREIENYRAPFEAGYQERWLFPETFPELDRLGKAARLFELSALMALDVNFYGRALDSLTEFAGMLLELKRYDLVPQVISSIHQMRGQDYQKELFAAVCDILTGDSHCEQGHYDAALEVYKTGYTHLALQTTVASYVLDDRLRNLSWRLRVQLPPERVRHWCAELEAEWLAHKIYTVRPDMFSMLENARLHALKRLARVQA